jgi:hypothetical protein
MIAHTIHDQRSLASEHVSSLHEEAARAHLLARRRETFPVRTVPKESTIALRRQETAHPRKAA